MPHLPPLLSITGSYLQMTWAKPLTTGSLGSAPDLLVRHRSETSDRNCRLSWSRDPAAPPPAGCILIDLYQHIFATVIFLTVLQFIQTMDAPADRRESGREEKTVLRGPYAYSFDALGPFEMSCVLCGWWWRSVGWHKCIPINRTKHDNYNIGLILVPIVNLFCFVTQFIVWI